MHTGSHDHSKMLALFLLGALLSYILCAGKPVSAHDAADKLTITRQEIEKLGINKIQDLLNRVPGVKAGDSSISVRGSSKVKVLLDGKPINDPTSSYGSVKWDMVPLEDIEIIEIYKGGGGIEFGDDSSGGVILITTRQIDRLQGMIETYGGNLDTGNININCQKNVGKWGVGASSGYEKTTGYEANGDKEKTRGGLKVQYRPYETARFMVSGDYFKEKKGVAGLPDFPTPHARKQYEMLSLLLLSEVGNLKSKTYLNDVDTRNLDSDKQLDTSLTVKEWGEDISTDLSVGRWGRFHCGGGFELARAASSLFDTRHEHSFWLFGAKNLTPDCLPLTFSIGLRGHFYSEFSNVINPEFRILYKQPRYSLRFSANQTNNIPSFLQRFNETSSTKPNPDLTIEKAQNYAVSFFVQPKDNVSATLSLFYNEIQDRITYVRGNDGIGHYENFGEVTYKGFETSVDWKVCDSLALNTSYIYLEAIDEETGDWLAVKPRHKVYADFIYTPVEPLSIVFDAKYVSKQYARSGNREPISDYYLANIRFEYDFSRFVVFGEVRNLFDRDYLYGDGYQAPPQTWIVGLRYVF